MQGYTLSLHDALPIFKNSEFYLRTRVLNTWDASFQHYFEMWQLTKFFNIYCYLEKKIPKNTPQSRRNLRYTIDTRALDINREFLRASDLAQRTLDRVVEKKSFSEKISMYSPWPREI